MSYQVVFDISERFPDALMAVPLIAIAAVSLVLLVTSRRVLLATAWLWLGIASVSVAVEYWRVVGGPYGFVPGFCFGLVGCLIAVGAFRNRRIDYRPNRSTSLRLVAAIALVPAVSVGLLGTVPQWRSFQLADDLSKGRATLTSGVVEESRWGNWGSETFKVQGRIFVLDDNVNTVGFNQTTANGGPIHDGLSVRIWTIGDTIVRLELATAGQAK